MEKIKQNVAIQTLKYLKTNDWNTISVEKIARKLKLDKKKIHYFLKKEQDLLVNINRYFDNKLILSSKFVENSSPKDMLFETLMMRFDFLNEEKKSIIKIFKVLKKNPKKFIFLLPSFLESMIVIAKISKIKINGLKGNLKIKGLMIIYFSTFLTWTKDDSQSLDKTMTHLDKNLSNAEKILNLI